MVRSTQQQKKVEIVINKIYKILSKYSSPTNGILEGKAGNVLFCYEYEKVIKKKEFKTIGSSFLELLESVHNSNSSYSFGIAGINLVVKQIINDEIFDSEDTDNLLNITHKYDILLLDSLIENSNHSQKYTDFLHGEFGVLWGISCFSKNKIYIQEYLQTFLKSIDIENNGYFNSYDRAKSKKTISLGLSHGVPAALVILSQIIENEVDKKEICQKIKDFISSKQNTNTLSLFPTMVDEQENPYSRLSWCYGDLGIGIAFWQAGKALNRNDWQQEAIHIFIHSSKRRNLKENGLKDAGLCHGTAGVAHIFNRMYWETKNPIFKETANYWIEETLKMAYHEDGLAGYKSWHGEDGWQSDYSFLEGIAGIGLALLSHISDEEPTWDKCLLLS